MWPLLLRAVPMSLRPMRLLWGLVLACLAFALMGIPLAAEGSEWLSDAPAWSTGAPGSWQTVRQLPAQLAGEFVGRLPGNGPYSLTWLQLATLAGIVCLLGIGGGAVARSAATEAAGRRRLSLTESLQFAGQRAVALFMCTVLPLAGIVLLVLGVAMLGLLFRGPGWTQTAGGYAYVLALLGGVGATVLTCAMFVGLPMLVPALACEGTDAIDAVQRVYAYVIARAGRVLGWLLLLVVQFAAAWFVLLTLMYGVRFGTAWASSIFLPTDAANSLIQLSASDATGNAAAISARARGTLAALNAATMFPLAAFAVSYFYTAGTLLYLVVRHSADGQDPEEIWVPRPAAAAIVDEDESQDEED